MQKTLFFFTSSYPFGRGETFIENEIEYLAEAFDKIIIVSNDTTNEQTRQIPENVFTLRLAYELTTLQKLASYFQLLNPLYWKEFKIIKNTYKQKITVPILNTMLQTLQKSSVFCSFIIKTLKEYTLKNDQIYLYSYWNNDMAFALASYKVNNPIVKAFARMHGWDVYFEANTIGYLPFRKYIFEKLNRVFAISEKGKSYYMNRIPEITDKIGVSRLGVKSNGFNPRNETKTLQLLTLSNIIPIKNLFVLIDALELLEIKYHWTHIGDGFLREELENYAQVKIPHKFQFKGLMKNREVLQYISKNPIDLFINVSLSEGIPVSIMEAMSFGIPCIGTGVGGTPEIVNTENGYLLSQNPSPIEVADAITRFYNLSFEEKSEMRKNGYDTWNNNYNAEKNYKAFVDEILFR